MKSIAFKDNAGGSTVMYYKDGETRHERIANALKELKHVGNITVYLVNGRKVRTLFRKSF